VLSSMTTPRLIQSSHCSYRPCSSAYNVTSPNSRSSGIRSPIKWHCREKTLIFSSSVFFSTAPPSCTLAIRQLSIELAPDSSCCLALARFGFQVPQTNTVACSLLSDRLSTLVAISHTN
jgi:hypothetical protein